MPHNFLIEIGTEELPPTSLLALSKAFTAGIIQKLDSVGLSYKNVTPYATPRRLAVNIEELADHTPIKKQTIWGPPVKIAFDAEGKPTKAALAFAKKNNIQAQALNTANDGKADKLCHSSESGGTPTKQLLADIVENALAQLPIKKRMRWGAHKTEFVRPIQWILMLVDDDILPAKIMGITTGNTTRGHRFHANRELRVKNPADYASLLHNEAKVVASFEKRQADIKKQISAIGESLGGHAVISADLLDEVTGLVEWPVALAGKFDAEFLSVPSEALISAMKVHQKYFHIVDSNDELMPYFITVANLESENPAEIVSGNEKVIRPRLADAAFFFNTDKKTALVDRREKLDRLMFQAQLGSVLEKSIRVEKLTCFIAKKLGIKEKNVARAAHLSKCDLVSNIVYEFPEMQGSAGFHYAKHDGETDAVAMALQEQYLPRFSGDALPSSNEGTILALADRIDTLTGIFGIGQKPTGSKDPFGLRRASLAALRLMVEKELDLDLRELIEAAAQNFSTLDKSDELVESLLSYMLDRFRSWYEEEGIKAETFLAVAAKNLSHPLDINRRVHAVAAFTRLPEAAALAAANKRVLNILAKLEEDPKNTIDTALFEQQAEKDLANEITKQQALVEPYLQEKSYQPALLQLASLREVVDGFFNDVMVMDDDLQLRKNRLALLQQLRLLFLHIADISLLAVKK